MKIGPLISLVFKVARTVFKGWGEKGEGGSLSV